jgi:hypothetical protein
MTPLDREVQAAVMGLPDHIRVKLFVRPDIEQDEGEVTVRAFSADGDRAVSYCIRKDRVVIVESSMSGAPVITPETLEHEAFK